MDAIAGQTTAKCARIRTDGTGLDPHETGDEEVRIEIAEDIVQDRGRGVVDTETAQGRPRDVVTEIRIGRGAMIGN